MKNTKVSSDESTKKPVVPESREEADKQKKQTEMIRFLAVAVGCALVAVCVLMVMKFTSPGNDLNAKRLPTVSGTQQPTEPETSEEELVVPEDWQMRAYSLLEGLEVTLCQPREDDVQYPPLPLIKENSEVLDNGSAIIRCTDEQGTEYVLRFGVNIPVVSDLSENESVMKYRLASNRKTITFYGENGVIYLAVWSAGEYYQSLRIPSGAEKDVFVTVIDEINSFYERESRAL